MKCSQISRLAMVMVATLAAAAMQAAAADLVNPAGLSYYGYGDSGAGYAGGSYAPGMAGYTQGMAGYTQGMAGYTQSMAGYPQGMAGYGSPAFASYPGYAGYGYAGYGASNFGGGNCGCDPWAGYCGGRRRHHCSFGGNSGCCASVWDGYCNGGCGAPVKVHRRHRPLGCGAGPCVDAACCGPLSGYATTCAPPVHRGHLRRHRNWGYGQIDACCGYDGATGMIMNQAPGQPTMGNPRGAEPLQTPTPGFDSEEPPSPMPAEESST